VIEWFSDQSELNLVGRAPTGTFTFVGRQGQSYTLTQIVDILNEGLLRARPPWLLIRGSRSFTIVPADEKVDPELVPRVAIDELDKHGITELVSVKVPLKLTKADHSATVIKRITGAFGYVQVDETTNSLIVQDTIGNLKRIIMAVQELEKAELDKRG